MIRTKLTGPNQYKLRSKRRAWVALICVDPDKSSGGRALDRSACPHIHPMELVTFDSTMGKACRVDNDRLT